MKIDPKCEILKALTITYNHYINSSLAIINGAASEIQDSGESTLVQEAATVIMGQSLKVQKLLEELDRAVEENDRTGIELKNYFNGTFMIDLDQKS